MEASSPMKTSRCATIVLVCFPWRMRVPTPTVLSSSSPRYVRKCVSSLGAHSSSERSSCGLRPSGGRNGSGEGSGVQRLAVRPSSHRAQDHQLRSAVSDPSSSIRLFVVSNTPNPNPSDRVSHRPYSSFASSAGASLG